VQRDEASLSAPASTDPPQPPAAPANSEREEAPLIQKLAGTHAATGDEVGAVLAQVKREGRITNETAWAMSSNGKLDFAARLADLRRKTSPPPVQLPQFECPECRAPVTEQPTGPCARCLTPEQPVVEVKSAALEEFRAAREQMRRPSL